MELSDEVLQVMNWAVYHELISINDLALEETVTRGEGAMILYQLIEGIKRGR